MPSIPYCTHSLRAVLSLFVARPDRSHLPTVKLLGIRLIFPFQTVRNRAIGPSRPENLNAGIRRNREPVRSERRSLIYVNSVALTKSARYQLCRRISRRTAVNRLNAAGCGRWLGTSAITVKESNAMQPVHPGRIFTRETLHGGDARASENWGTSGETAARLRDRGGFPLLTSLRRARFGTRSIAR